MYSLPRPYGPAAIEPPCVPEPRLIGKCAECGKDLYEDDELRLGHDDQLYCDAVCAGYGQSLPCASADWVDRQ